MEIKALTAGPYQTNTYLLLKDDAVVVVDPGMGVADPIDEFVQENELRLESIVLTHGHIDHTRDAGELARRHQVAVYIHPEDAFMVERGAGVPEHSRQLFDADNMVAIEDLRHLEDQQSINLVGTEFKVHHVPGHSPGCALLVGSDLALVGDVIFRGSIGRVDLPYSDPEAMRTSLERAREVLGDDLLLLPGHGPSTDMKTEKANNPYLRGASIS